MINKGNNAQRDKGLEKRGNIIVIVSLVICLGLMFLGVSVIPRFGPAIAILIAACIIPVVIAAVNLILVKRESNTAKARTIEERQEMLLSQRREVAAAEKENLVKLRKYHRIGVTIAILILCISVVIALFSLCTVRTNALNGIFAAFAIMLMSAAIARLTVGLQTKPKLSNSFVEEKDFPHIHSLARKAADEMGCKEKIRIAFIPDNNIGVGKVGNTVYLSIGLLLINSFNDSELYAILLHEFSHVAADKAHKEEAYGRNLSNGSAEFIFSGLTDLLFLYPDYNYSLYYMFYQYAVSVEREAAADRAMLGGSSAAAASALIKTYYIDRAEWEEQAHDNYNIWESEKPAPDTFTRRIDYYKKSIAERGEFWSSLIPREIIARNSSHPTIKMRLDALGIADYLPSDEPASPEFAAEVKKALDRENGNYKEFIAKDYGELRKTYYLDPIGKVNKWKEEGMPLDPAGYRSIVESLLTLGRVSEAEALCDRAIEELPSAASAFACFTKARLLLHRYDDAGIELMYHAIDENSNYIDAGLEEIGTYCCLTGNQAELERYRAKAIELAHKQEDEYDETGELNKNDDLSPEHLPEGKLEEILAVIKASDNGVLANVYLVHKKITEDFFTSAFVLEYEQVKESSDYEKQDEIYEKVFNYLDTESDWQYSLFSADDVEDVMPRIRSMKDCLVYSKKK